MTPALAFTIVGFVFAVLVQAALFAYFYGRLTMKVEMLERESATHATKGEVTAVVTDLTELTAMYKKFLTDTETRNERDDARIMKAIEHVEERLEAGFEWVGARLMEVGKFVDLQARFNRKLTKATGVQFDSTERMEAVRPEEKRGDGGASIVTGLAMKTGPHAAIVPAARQQRDRESSGGKDPRRE